MKKWTGGSLIVTLALILVLRYILIENKPHKQSTFSFFHPYLNNGSELVGNGVLHHPQPAAIVKVLKKTPLIAVDGIDDLYSFMNVSEEVSRVRLVWAQMRNLLSRSDSLPETANGIKEGSIAWKELISTLENEKVLGIIRNRQHRNSEDKSCRFSVSASNLTLSTNESLLEIPCGFVQDSSVTVVGVLDGLRGNFQIELIGSQSLRKPDPPTILKYNVSLLGDNFTKDPVIVQNTWTPEQGWGKEERCPYGSSGHLTVDGLTCCNEQVGGTFMEENHNTTGKHLASDKSLNKSREGALARVNFPFIEGHPFTATLWTGPEGFHMTVNGRHETSFAYRERLEPWLVSGVRVQGGLNILSVLVNGLPVSEDLDLVVDVENLKAPPVSRKRLFMLVGVFSTGNNFECRMALRRTWMQYEAIRSGDVAVRFLIGFHKNSQVNVELWKEAQMYGDIQLMPFVDYYSLITLKTIAICILGTKVLPAKYIMKTDDDAFVRIDEVVSSLRGRKITQGLLYGHISFDSEPDRDGNSKWYINREEWPHTTYPPWAHGPGYIVSRDIAKFIVQSHQERNLNLFKLEDVAMGIWIEQYKRSGQEIHYVPDDRFHHAGCESGYVLAHYQGPRLVLCLWEKLQKEHEPNCCE